MSPPYILAGDIQDEIGGRTKLSGIDHLCIVKFSKYMRRSHGNDNMLKLCLSVQAYDDFCKYFFPSLKCDCTVLKDLEPRRRTTSLHRSEGCIEGIHKNFLALTRELVVPWLSSHS